MLAKAIHPGPAALIAYWINFHKPASSTLLMAMAKGTAVSIPNTEVKPFSADGTQLTTA